MSKPNHKELGKKEWLTTTTAAYFRSAQSGNSRALEDFVQRIQKRLIGFFIVLTNDPVRAQDLSQEVYIKLIENIKGLDNPKQVVPWLYRIAKNHFIDDIRRSQTRMKVSDGLRSMQQNTDQELDSLLDVAKALQKLDPEDRYLATLVYVEGFSYEEAAEVFQTTEAGVRNRLYRLRTKFNPEKKSA